MAMLTFHIRAFGHYNTELVCMDIFFILVLKKVFKIFINQFTFSDEY